MSKPKEAIGFIEQSWKKHYPSSLFQYDFIDKKLNDQYQAEDRFAKFFIYFSVLSLLIACLGLLGLTAYATQQRMKEISVRKVLGATVSNIVSMLSKDFMKLVGIAAVIAFPLGWYIMNKWLEDFSYRISIPWWVFAVGGIIAIMIALITVSVQAIKAAVSNPVKSLRME